MPSGMKSPGPAQHKVEGLRSKDILSGSLDITVAGAIPFSTPLIPGSVKEVALCTRFWFRTPTASWRVLPQLYKTFPPGWSSNYIFKRPVYRSALPAALGWQEWDTMSEFHEPGPMTSLLWLWNEFFVTAALCGMLWGWPRQPVSSKTAIPAEVLHTWKAIYS